MCINVDTIFQFSKISQVTQSHVVLSSHKIHVRVGFFFQKNAMLNLSILIIHHFLYRLNSTYISAKTKSYFFSGVQNWNP